MRRFPRGMCILANLFSATAPDSRARKKKLARESLGRLGRVERAGNLTLLLILPTGALSKLLLFPSLPPLPCLCLSVSLSDS